MHMTQRHVRLLALFCFTRLSIFLLFFAILFRLLSASVCIPYPAFSLALAIETVANLLWVFVGRPHMLSTGTSFQLVQDV